MIEAYAFLAAFAAQIVVASILSPTRLIAYVRGWAKNFGSERFAEIYPHMNYHRWVVRFVMGYRAAHAVIALIGMAFLTWFFTVIRQPNWTDDVASYATWYFMLQLAPLILTSLYAVIRYWKVLIRPSQETRRKATLQRRGLSDYVSPAAIVAWVVSYPLFVAYSTWLDLYVYDNATLSKQCWSALVGVTLAYVFNGFVIYKSLYGKRNPLVSNEGRAHSIGVQVKSCVYSSISVPWFLSLFGTLGQPSLTEWRPFALSLFFVLCTLLTMADLNARPRKSDVDQLGSTGKVLP